MQGIKAWGENSTKKYTANELLIQSKAGVPKRKIAEILKGLDAYAEEEIPQIRIKKINVSAMDNVGINRIEFYVDNVLNSVNYSDTNTYTWTWNTRKLKAGEHIVTVKAYDYAGNEASDAVIVYKESTVSKKRS